MSCFRYVGCYQFCERVERVQHHPKLTRLFILNLHDNRVTLAGVTFALSTAIIFYATGIPNVGERWYKSQDLDDHYFEPYLKTRYKNEGRKFFPFSLLLSKYAPVMKIIMRYFTCEGRFSKLYTYHIRLLMHFTRVRMLNIPYFLF